MSEKKSSMDKILEKRKRDPSTIILWGILLLFYGIYRFYQVIINLEKINNLQLQLIEPVIMTVFSLIVIFSGYRSKKQTDNNNLLSH
jgi:uncharacterized membrane protein YidH (DUF202 family)